MAEEVEKRGYTFPYLFDDSQEVAKAYQASCTPDFFLYDRDRKREFPAEEVTTGPAGGGEEDHDRDPFGAR